MRSHKQIPAVIRRLVYAQARGNYQYDLLRGEENWSGSSLKGAQKDWASKYRRSRFNLLCRIEDALTPRGWSVDTVLIKGTDGRFRKELVLESPSGLQNLW